MAIHKPGAGVRQRGHAFERKIVNELKEMGFHAETARYANRSLDDLKVDIVTDLPFNIQCKCHNTFKNPLPVMEEMPKDNRINVVFQKVVSKDEIVVLSKENFYKLLRTLSLPDIMKLLNN